MHDFDQIADCDNITCHRFFTNLKTFFVSEEIFRGLLLEMSSQYEKRKLAEIQETVFIDLETQQRISGTNPVVNSTQILIKTLITIGRVIVNRMKNPSNNF